MMFIRKDQVIKDKRAINNSSETTGVKDMSCNTAVKDLNDVILIYRFDTI